jgi:hypothetical protein
MKTQAWRRFSEAFEEKTLNQKMHKALNLA